MERRSTTQASQKQAWVETANSVHRLVAIMLATRNRVAIAQARESLQSLPRVAVIPALIDALNRAETHRAFGRTAYLMSALADDEVIHELIRHAHSHRRFRITAISALAKSDHPN